MSLGYFDKRRQAVCEKIIKEQGLQLSKDVLKFAKTKNISSRGEVLDLVFKFEEDYSIKDVYQDEDKALRSVGKPINWKKILEGIQKEALRQVVQGF